MHVHGIQPRRKYIMLAQYTTYNNEKKLHEDFIFFKMTLFIAIKILFIF